MASAYSRCRLHLKSKSVVPVLMISKSKLIDQVASVYRSVRYFTIGKKRGCQSQ